MIYFENITKQFNGNYVLKNFNLHCKKGEATVVIGLSGSGKSVAIKHALGLLKPDAGRVTVDGIEVGKLSHYELTTFRKRFGMCFQDAALFDYMTVAENISFPVREHTKKSEAEIADIVAEKLSLVGMPGIENKFPSELSGGMRKRVGFARAIVMDPEILVIDEPTTGLDPIMIAVINNLINRLKEKLSGLTCLVISHELATIFDVCDRIAMLYKGEIVEYGSPEEMRNPKNKIVQQFINGQEKGPIHIN